MLLINGMPVIHIELKKSGVSVSQACHQIEKYSGEGVFNRDFYFHWADFNNEPINGWQDIASSLLSIPMAHQLIGFYTVADDSDGVLKVMRSYQYYAANAISDRVAKLDWKDHNGRGGYIWHTTGSGKTMTSFKSAQLIADSKDADKVIFLMDRIELGTQSLREYRNFASENESVQATENTGVLVTKLKSANPADTLIVTSIQKMSNIKDEDGGLKARDLALMQAKCIVFIVGEAHRSARLAHKEPHIRIERTPEKQIDILIVVDQMLTGFDSRWINTLYLDKLLQYESIIQAFSRTNRLFGPDKPFGTIRYYRKPHTMENNIEKAVKLYSGDRPLGLFVDRLEHNLNQLNAVFDDITELYSRSGVDGFTRIPEDLAERGKFAKLFRELNLRLESARIQGFTWNQQSYPIEHPPGENPTVVEMHFVENDYLILALRYKELYADGGQGGSTGADDVPYEIDGYRRQSKGPGFFPAPGRQACLPLRDEQENPQLPERSHYRSRSGAIGYRYDHLWIRIPYFAHLLYT
jgi:type I site-specific restriction-modification system R (restriction) subunit